MITLTYVLIPTVAIVNRIKNNDMTNSAGPEECEYEISIFTFWVGVIPRV